MTTFQIEKLPENVLAGIFRHLYRESIDQTRIASPKLHAKIKEYSARHKLKDEYDYLQDVIAKQPRNIDTRGNISDLAWSPDNTQLAFGQHLNVQIWNAETGRQIDNGFTENHTRWINSIAWSPDGKQVVSSGYDGTIRIWDVETERQIGDPFLQIDNDNDSIFHVDVDWSQDGRLASSDKDGNIRIWDPNTRQQIGDPLIGDRFAIVTWSQDGKLASGGKYGNILVWKPQIEDTPIQLNGHSDMVNDIAWSPDDTLLASGSADGSARMWDPITGQQIGNPLFIDPFHDADRITCITWSPDSTRVAIGRTIEGEDGEIHIVDTITRTTFSDYNRWPIKHMDWSSNNRLAISEKNGFIYIVTPSSDSVESRRA